MWAPGMPVEIIGSPIILAQSEHLTITALVNCESIITQEYGGMLKDLIEEVLGIGTPVLTGDRTTSSRVLSHIFGGVLLTYHKEGKTIPLSRVFVGKRFTLKKEDKGESAMRTDNEVLSLWSDIIEMDSLNGLTISGGYVILESEEGECEVLPVGIRYT
jgi:hypothetical protein